MAPLKSPEFDSFSAYFYQSYYHIVGNEVCYTIVSFLNEDVFDARINHTYIVLIPKISNLNQTNDFWSVSLCNVIYKLLSTVLSNRLK